MQMTITFAGPVELRRLDELAVTIRNDHPWRGKGSATAGGPTPEQAAAHVWGPYRFAPGSAPPGGAPPGGSGPDGTGRASAAGGLPVDEAVVFILEGTRPPSWSTWTLAGWRRDMGPFLRLELACQTAGWPPWNLPCEVKLISGRGSVEVP